MAAYIRCATNKSLSNTAIIEFSEHSTLQHVSIRKGGVQVQIHSFSTSALHGVESSSSLPSFLPQGTNPGTLWIGGWMYPIFVLDGLEERKVFCI